MADIFDGLRAQKESGAALQREANICLESIGEFIQERGMPLIPASYLGAIMIALERHSTARAVIDNEAGVPEGLMYLLSIVCPHLSPAIFVAKFQDIGSTFEQLLQAHSNSDNFIKSSIPCLGAFMCAQAAGKWKDVLMQKLFKTLLRITIHQRPKVRHAACKAVYDILQVCSASGSPVAGKQLGAFVSNTLKKCTPKDTHPSLFICGLLKSIVVVLPGDIIAQLCPPLLHLPSVGQSVVTLQAFQTLEALVSSPNPQVTGELVGQIGDGLLSVQPMPNSDEREGSSFVSVLHSVLLRLLELDLGLYTQKVAGYVAAMAEYLSSDQSATRKMTFEKLKSFLESGLRDELIQHALNAHNMPTPLHSVIVTFESLLQYRYKGTWNHVFGLLALLFRRLGRASQSLLSNLLAAMGALHSTSEAHYKSLLEDAVGAAVTAMGPKRFLEILPLSLEDVDSLNNWNYTELSRSWLLPLFKSHIKNTELRCFGEYFLPLAARLNQLSTQASNQGSGAIGKKLRALVEQIWMLFPDFCVGATDIVASFKHLAKTLATVIEKDSDLRPFVCRGLWQLLDQNGRALREDIAAGFTEQQAKANLAAIASFSQQFLQVLFTVFRDVSLSKPGTGEGQPLLDVIQAFSTVASPALLSEMFKVVMQKWLQATTGQTSADAHQRKIEAHALSDLALALIRGLDNESIVLLYRVVKPQLQEEDAVLQKKAYKVLHRLLEFHPDWATEAAGDIRGALTESLANCSISAKKARLLCIRQYLARMPSSQLSIVPEILPEVLVCMKDNNIKAKRASFDILIDLGRKMLEAGAFQHFLQMVLGGLAGSSPHMKSATVIGLSRLLYEFSNNVDGAVISELIQTVLLLLKEKSREVCKSVLGFLKVAVFSIPLSMLNDLLPTVMTGMLVWVGDNRNHFRMKIRFLLEKLIKKLGYETVLSLVPEEHKKLLWHIKKMKDRSQRAREKTKVDNANRHQEYEDILESDDEDMDMDNMNMDQIASAVVEHETKKKNKFGKSNQESGHTWLKETGNENPLDFLDPRAAQHVLSSNPTKKNKRSRDDDIDDIPMDESGRLLIQEDGDSAESSSEDDAADHTLKNALWSSKVKAKQRSMQESMAREVEAAHHNAGRKMPKPVKRARLDKDEKDATKDNMTVENSGRKGKMLQHNSTGLSLLARRRMEKQKRKTEGHNVRVSGEEYRSHKAAGDVKKQGRPDPFAYIQLNPKMLNKRKRLKAVRSFETVLHKSSAKAPAGTGTGTANAKKKARKPQKSLL
eukprot:GILJ01007559.1.p1 GENE.GILJ01007559.1~~GILJ01007559.1.p1  ORF type:complete len:1269 (-),score=253.53 GILJ01007559.1:82-3888(-)